MSSTKAQRQKVAKRKSPVRRRKRNNSATATIGAITAFTQSRAFHWSVAAVIWAVAAFALVSLISFSPQDPDFDHAASLKGIQNLGGVIGAYLAGTLIRAFGTAAYLVPLVMAAVGVDVIDRKRKTPVSLRLPASILLLFGCAAAVAMLWPEAKLHGLRASGWIGHELGTELIQRYLGLGGLILVAPILLLSLAGAVGHSGVVLVQRGTGWIFRRLTEAVTNVAIWVRATARHAAARRREQAEKKQEKEAKGARKPKFVEPEIGPVADPAQQRSLSGESTEPELEIDKPKEVQPAKSAVQRTLVTASQSYSKPDLDLLEVAKERPAAVDEKVLKAKAQILEHKIKEYGIEGRVVAVRPGPVISVYEFQPAAGVKVSKIANLEDDLALATESLTVRIVAPIPGRNVVGIEIPNRDREVVALRSIVESSDFWQKKLRLPVALGKDTGGAPIVADLTQMPHVLVAGATGAGKSVGINCIIVSLLYKHSPEDLRLYLIDPKRLELNFYQDIPHLEGHDVVVDPHDALGLLQALVREMEDRYEWMAHAKVRSITTYNKAVAEGRVEPREGEEPEHFPYLVCIVDELADLMMVTRKAIEEPIARLAQMARAAGIHLVLATQRPSVDVITGLIKANFPARIAFKVSSKADARVVLDQQGAENLLGKGDMLFKPPTSDVLKRVHGAFVSEEEVSRVVSFWKEQAEQHGEPSPAVSEDLLQEEIDQVKGVGGSADGDLNDVDEELFERAVEAARDEGVVSTSRIQRLLSIGYNRAARIMEAMEARGMVGPQQGAGKPRKFLGSEDE